MEHFVQYAKVSMNVEHIADDYNGKVTRDVFIYDARFSAFCLFADVATLLLIADLDFKHVKMAKDKIFL